MRAGRVLAAILLLALVVRVVAILATSHYEPLFDALDYDRHARSIADGDGYPSSWIVPGDDRNAFRPPLYPYLLGGAYAVSGDSQAVGRVLGALMGVGVVLLVYLIADALWNRRMALASALLAAVFPPLVMLNAALLTEQPFLLVELAAVVAALYSARARGSPGWAVVAGVFCGLAALARANGILLALPIALGLLAAGRGRGVRAWAAPAAVVAGATLAILPWTVRNYVVFDAFVPITTQSGFGIAGIYNDQAIEREGYRALWIRPSVTREYGPIYRRRGADEAEIDDEVRRRALDWAADHPGYAVEAAVLNTARTLELADLPPGGALVDHNLLGLSERAADLVKWSFYLVSLLALAGAVALARGPRARRGPWWMWVTPVLLMLAGSAVLGFTRYRVPAYPFLVLLAAAAITEAVRLRRAADR